MTELTVYFCMSVQLCLGDVILAGLRGNDARVLGGSITARGAHSLIFGALLYAVVACHNARTEKWLRIAAAAVTQPLVSRM